MSSAQGEDRSDYQAVLPPVDRNGKKLDFIFFKATEGDSWVSTTYARNIALARQSGVPFGSYHFLHPSLNVDAQVALFMSTVAEHGGLEPGAMLACDSEIASGANEQPMLFSDRSDLLVRHPDTGEARIRDGVNYPHHLIERSKPKTLSATLVGSATQQFLVKTRTAVEVALGGDYCQELVYSFENMLPQLASCTSFPLWVAYYSNTAPPSVGPWAEWKIWQYAGGGGNGGSDQDGFNGDVAAFTSWVNAKKPTPAPPPPPVQSGQFSISMPNLGVGEHNPDWYVFRAQWLIAGIGKHSNIPNTQVRDDGIFGPLTEAAVKEIQVSARIARNLASASGKIGEAEWKFLIAGVFGNA